MNFELTKGFLNTLKSVIKDDDSKRVLKLISELHEADIAEVIDALNNQESQFVYRLLDEETASDVLVELEEDVRERFLASLTSKEIAEQIDNLDSDDAADVIGELLPNQQEEVIAHIEDVDQARDIVDLLNYEEGTAGSLMAKELIAVRESWTVLKCTKEMRKQASDLDFVYAVYVTDENDILLGTISLKRMLLTPAEEKVTNIIKPDVIYAKAGAPLEEVSQLMEKYDLVVLPVVDKMHRLVGRITIDDVVDVIKDEAEKDYQMASGISENVEATDKIWLLTRARLPWLLVGLLGGVLGARVIGGFELSLHIHPEMAFFIPLITAMGGNVGVQSSAIIVQGLANKSLGLDSIWNKLGKEFLVALINGLVCSTIILVYNFFFADSTSLMLTVSTALLCVIIIAGLLGTFIPLTLDKFKIDPALATGPFVTTLNDIFGLFIYFFVGHLMY